MSSLARKNSTSMAESGGDDALSPFQKVQQWGHDAILARLLKLESVTFVPSSSNPHDSRNVISFTVPRQLCNAAGTLHGGAVALIFDNTTSMAIRPCSREGFWDGGHVSRNRYGDPARRVNTTYLRPAAEGTKVFVESWVVHLGKRLGQTKGLMRLGSEDGKVCYTCEHDKANARLPWACATCNYTCDINSDRARIHAATAPMDLGDEESSPWGDVPSRSSPGPGASTAEHKDTLDAGSPAPSAQPAADSAPAAASAPRSPAARGPRRRQYGLQPTKLEAVDDPLGPLGAPSPTTGTDSAPPAPPQKEAAASRTTRPAPGGASTPSLRGMMDSVDLDGDNDEQPPSSHAARIPPPVQAASNATPQRHTQPSVSVEQAAKPSFAISVGDPHKVGDLTSSHTEYSVTTKTTSKGYRNPEFTVSRRYRDFLWLYTQLHNNNPGVIIPPPPEKQAVGRFEADFVESRRSALERMLNKAAAHPVLQHDSDLKLFLESEAFSMDIKNKERKDPGLGESKGMFGSMLSGSSGKFVEHDDWFHDRRIYLDALEAQLKALLKATDAVVTQRKGLAEACGDFSASLHSLSAVELSPSLSGPLDSLSDIQIRIRELYERQAQQDILTMGIVIDEYIRLIGSVKTAFQQRQKAYHSWHSAEQELQKRKTNQDKLLRQGRSQQDRLNQLSADVADAERKVHQARLLFDDMGRLMRSELERFEREKVEDFKSGVETFLESAVEAQKELIEIWETFLMQLDTEEGDTFVPPAGVVASSNVDQPSHDSSNNQDAERPDAGKEGVSGDQD
ncbi:hypothetical protein G6011_05692 [Alternaria panax]|uniref:PX domain-containing protein n=1 Tax=Alternaria panax TaxID=48097 RepID=A0AAD4FDV9_9PLEO|nr:hypothetical protein G6011_05692 [Alternaria panax]